MSERAKPVYAWAIKMRGSLDLASISDSRGELISIINRPAGQSVVRVKITEATPPTGKSDRG